MCKIKTLFLSLLTLFSIKAMAADVVFITLHPGGARHFEELARGLERNNISTKILAGALVYSVLDIPKNSSIPLVAFKKDAILDLCEKCVDAKVIITECGDPFFAVLHRELASHFPSAKRFCYYDNIEPFVPGGYSESVYLASKEPIDGFLFANTQLAEGKIYRNAEEEIDLSSKMRIGIGYFPLQDAAKIKEERKNKVKERASFFKREGILDKGDPLFLYVGGANTVYYEKAFPHFLNILEVLDKKPLILFQQHPRALSEGNRDLNLLKEKKNLNVIISSLPFFEGAKFCDAVLYYQTSSAPTFVLAGIPAFQIGHEPYRDILVRNGLAPTITNGFEFANAVKDLEKKELPENILEMLGFSPHWEENLLQIME